MKLKLQAFVALLMVRMGVALNEVINEADGGGMVGNRFNWTWENGV